MNIETNPKLIENTKAAELMLTKKETPLPDILCEDLSRRTPTEKHFRLRNGNYMAVSYDYPIHKWNPDAGVYDEIIRKTNETQTDFESDMGTFKARFPKTEGKERFITVSKEEYEVAFKYVPAQANRRTRSRAVFSDLKKEDPLDICTPARVRYQKADTGVDLQYDINENGIKESVILSKCPESQIFTFRLKVKGVRPELGQDKKTVLFLPSDPALNNAPAPMMIPSAFMLDKNGARFEELHYELRETEEGIFLDIVPDTDWLAAPDRVYPVTLDPWILVTCHSNDRLRLVGLCSDGTVVPITENTETRRVGVDSSRKIHRVYMEVDLPSLPPYYKITQASLTLYRDSYTTFGENAEEYTVAPFFDPDNKTPNIVSFNWDNVQHFSVGSPIDTFPAYEEATTRVTPIRIDMTQTLSEWYKDGKRFHGIVIKKSSESPCYCNGYIRATYVNLCSHWSTYQPRMQIIYACEDAYADHQKYHTFENDRAGTGSINLYTGKLSFAHGDVRTEGSTLPITVSHLYRHEYVNENTKGENPYGNGWKLSVEQKLEVVNSGKVMAVYTDAKGKRHYFTSDTLATDGYASDDAGLGLICYKTDECACEQKITHIVSDGKGNKMTFNDKGQLIQLIDSFGNNGCLAYADGKLLSVTDGNHRMVLFDYNSQGQLASVTDANGRAIRYGYDAFGDLVTITYPSAETAPEHEGILKSEFTYDSSHRLISVTDYSGMIYRLTYDENGRVKKLSFSGKRSVADNQVSESESEVSGHSVSFEYRAKATTIIEDRTGVRTVSKFDENGRELSSYLSRVHADDSIEKSETTPATLSGYLPVKDDKTSEKSGKYRSFSLNINREAGEEINLIRNGLFKNRAEDPLLPDNWSVAGTPVNFSDSYLPGGKACGFPSDAYGEKYLSQTFTFCDPDCCCISPQAGKVLLASAWAKANGSVLANSADSLAKFRLVLKAYYEDGTTEERTENFETDQTDWQFAAVPLELVQGHLPIKVSLKLDYTENTGSCYFTNVRLTFADAIFTTNTYQTGSEPLGLMEIFGQTQKIKMVAKKVDAPQKICEYTNDQSDIVSTVIWDENGHSFATYYQYDANHNLTKMEDFHGMVTEYAYNGYGQEVERKTYHKDHPDAYFLSQHSYDDNQLLETESDPRYTYEGQRLETHYQNDAQRNLVLKQTTPNGQAYHYDYDEKSDDLLSLSAVTENKTSQNQYFYTRGYLTRVAHNGFDFGFSYDELGRKKAVTVGDTAVRTALQTVNYRKSGTNDLIENTYATGEKNILTVDWLGNPTGSVHVDKNGLSKTSFAASYDPTGKIRNFVDNEENICYNYEYDSNGNITRIGKVDKTTDRSLPPSVFHYTPSDQLFSHYYGAVGQTYRLLYEERDAGVFYPDNEVVGLTLQDKYTDKIQKDSLRRTAKRTFRVGNQTLFEDSFRYLFTPNGEKKIETEIVSGLTSRVYGADADTAELNYTYDKAGLLESVSRGSSLLSRYYYDGLNRLRREDDHLSGKTCTWEYDAGGNILSRKEYALCNDIHLGDCQATFLYTYKTEGWKDRLDSYNGLACSYDAMGNPIVYLGHTLAFTKVRQLTGFDGNTFAYNANGVRIRKNNTVYTLEGSKILRETDGTHTLTYYYGSSGIVGFRYNDTDYYFRKNLQGDVSEIYTASGVRVASYTYNAWGKVLAVNNYTADNLGDLNPIRYRSYYYDAETGLYYLNSRYYDPETGRFVNADTADVLKNTQYDINGLNLYAYCDNNPVTGRDDEGNMAFWKKLLIASAIVVGIALVAAATAATCGAGCAALTVLVGAARGALMGAISGAITGAITGGVQGAIEGYQETGTLEGTLRAMGRGALSGAVKGAQDGMITGLVTGGLGGLFDVWSGNPMFCFVAGTTVLTTLGKKAIETVKVGDTIPCVDHITGEATEKKVISTTINKVTRLIELDIDGEMIQCTETHPFQVKGKGWVDACNLTPGDVVYTKNWGTATVQSVNLLELDEPVEVFNFEVEDCHTYFVGDIDILVHNGGCRGSAVKKAWKNEVNNVKNGGNGISRTWTETEKVELLAKGKVKGYVGHHMKSVKGYPELAGDPTNIQFLTRAKHFEAHSFNWQTITHGFFNG